MARLLSQAGARPNAHDGAALVEASALGHADVVALLLASGARVGRDHALFVAAKHGRTGAVRALMAAGVRVGPGRWQPLVAAARGGHAETLKVLLRACPHLNFAAEDGMRADALLRSTAAWAGDPEVVELIKNKTAFV